MQLDSNPEPLSLQTNTQSFGKTGQKIDLCSQYLSVLYMWLFVISILRTRFRVNPDSVVAWMAKNSLLEEGADFEVEVTATGLQP